MAETAEIVIKRVKKGEHAHHGGAWKVAYADFVTAMMAFFLLLWLLNATTEVQKKGISDYFSPSTVSTSSGGAGGLLGGQSISSPGAMTSRTAVPSVSLNLKPTAGSTEGETEEPGGASDEADNTDESKTKAEKAKTEAEKAAIKAAEAKQKEEESGFNRIENELIEAVGKDPELRALADNILVDNTKQGLRVQVIDKEGKSMFALGSAKMYERTRMLLSKIAKVMESMPNKIRITGHTDSLPFRGRAGYGNWELSSDRAQSARRAMVEGGLSMDRVESVSGKASRDLLVKDDPTSPRNRRISILLLREAPPPGPKPAKDAKEGEKDSDKKAAKDAKEGGKGSDKKPAKDGKKASSGSAPNAPPADPKILQQDWTGPRLR